MLRKLAAARVESGYETKKSFVDALNVAGLAISNNTYNRIESGKQTADIETAFFIADFLKRNTREIFLDISTLKMSRKKENQRQQSNSKSIAI